ncbi:MAG TPA: nucleotidyltransferase family protein [Longimicrobium sp.]|nr:nucleotidyltransferase family protein [Longimicrobium sp.]
MNIDVSRDRIEEFCRKWHVAEFALFGSVLRDDFRPDSDVDVLVTFEPGVRPTLDWLDMEDELTAAFGRKVDLVEKASIRNPFVRRHVLDHHSVLHAA